MKAARKITAGAALAAGALLLAAAGCKNDTPSAPELTGTVSVSGKARRGDPDGGYFTARRKRRRLVSVGTGSGEHSRRDG